VCCHAFFDGEGVASPRAAPVPAAGCVSSSPGGATATLVCEGKPAGSGVTPTTFTIGRRAGDCNLTIAKDGFADQSILVEQGVNPVYWANFGFMPLILIGLDPLDFTGRTSDQTRSAVALGAVGIFSTDFITGAVHGHRPKAVDVVLKPK
jgi:hypothetical protein